MRRPDARAHDPVTFVLTVEHAGLVSGWPEQKQLKM